MWKVLARNDIMTSVNCNPVYSLVYNYSSENTLINTSIFSSVQTKFTQPFQINVLEFFALSSASVLSQSDDSLS